MRRRARGTSNACGVATTVGVSACDWRVLHQYRFGDKTVDIARVVRRRDAYR